MVKGVWEKEANILTGSVLDVSHSKRMLSPEPLDVDIDEDTLIVSSSVCVLI